MNVTDHPLGPRGRRVRRQLSRDDIGNQGRVLLNDFIVERIKGDNVQSELRQEELLEPGTPSGPPMEHMKEIARALRCIADELDQDQKMQRIISKVPPDAPQQTFLNVANDFFRDGVISWGRIVALFYFGYKMACKLITLKHVLASSYGQQTAKDVHGSVRKAFVLDDSCIKSLKSVFLAHLSRQAHKALDKIPLIRAIINWVINFIVETVAPWIIERGGWEAIEEYFGTPKNQLIFVAGAGILAAGAVVVYNVWYR